MHAPDARALRRARVHRRRLHDHVHGSRRDLQRRAGDPERIRILARHHGLDSGELPLGLRAVPNSRRMARRPHRPAPRARHHRHLVERLHLAHRVRVERRVDDRRSIPVRHRRSGRVSDRHAIAFALDAARRTRLRARHHARRIAAGRGADAAAGGLDHHALQLARRVRDFRHHGHRVGRRLVLLLSRHCPRNTRASTRPSAI